MPSFFLWNLQLNLVPWQAVQQARARIHGKLARASGDTLCVIWDLHPLVETWLSLHEQGKKKQHKIVPSNKWLFQKLLQNLKITLRRSTKLTTSRWKTTTRRAMGKHHGTLKLYTERFERNRGSAWIPIGKSIFKADWRQNTEMRFKWQTTVESARANKRATDGCGTWKHVTSLSYCTVSQVRSSRFLGAPKSYCNYVCINFHCVIQNPNSCCAAFENAA